MNKQKQFAKIILASSSPARKKLLENTGVNFKVIPSKYEENMEIHESPSHLVKKLSLGKALDIAKKYPEAIVIGADTIAYIIGRKNHEFTQKKLGKPENKEEAEKMLKAMSGKIVKIYTGFTIIHHEKKLIYSDYESTKVKIKNLNPAEIQNYLKTDEPLQAAGALVIEKQGGLLVESINGDYNTIIGLPLFKLNQALKKFGIEII